jgi:hypothetical protein
MQRIVTGRVSWTTKGVVSTMPGRDDSGDPLATVIGKRDRKKGMQFYIHAGNRCLHLRITQNLHFLRTFRAIHGIYIISFPWVAAQFGDAWCQ